MKRLSRKIVAGVPLDVFGVIDSPRRLSLVSVMPSVAGGVMLTVVCLDGAGVPWWRSQGIANPGIPCVLSTAFDLSGANTHSFPMDMWINPGDVVEATSSADGDLIAVYEPLEEC